MTAEFVIRNAEVEGRPGVDVRLRAGRICEVGTHLWRRGVDWLDARGGAVLPGLADHHLHLHALAAARASVRCGPPDVRTPDGLRQVLGGSTLRRTGFAASAMSKPSQGIWTRTPWTGSTPAGRCGSSIAAVRCGSSTAPRSAQRVWPRWSTPGSSAARRGDQPAASFALTTCSEPCSPQRARLDCTASVRISRGWVSRRSPTPPPTWAPTH